MSGAAARTCWVLLATVTFLLVPWVTTGALATAAGPLPTSSSHPGNSSSSAGGGRASSSTCSPRLVVGHQPGMRQAIVRQLKSQGYTVVRVGPGFVAVVACGDAHQEPQQVAQHSAAVAPSQQLNHTTGSSTGGSSSTSSCSGHRWWCRALSWLSKQLAGAGPHVAHSSSTAGATNTTTSPGVLQYEQQQQQQTPPHAHHMRRLSQLPGVAGVQVDPVRRLLAGRPTLSWGPSQDAALLAHRKAVRLTLQQQLQQQQVGSGSVAGRSHNHTHHNQQQQQQQPVQRRLHPSQARRVVSDWSGSQLIMDPYAAWSPADACASRDASLAVLPGVWPPIGEVVPWGVATVLQDPAPQPWDGRGMPNGRPNDSRNSRQAQGSEYNSRTSSRNGSSGSSGSRVAGPRRGTRPSLEAMFPPPRPGASAANSPVNSQRANIIQCVIDSGLEAVHEEYVEGTKLPSNGAGGQWAWVSRTAAGANNLLSGCNTSATAGGCPFPWSSDTVGHGTHVTGTIAAPRNGRGVVGITPGGAEVYVLRIWDTTGDVSQGEGPYASDLVAAYQSCHAYLMRRRANEPGRIHRMVVNLSFGSPGPLSVEEAYLAAAAAQEDMLFVGAAGNNGTGGGDWSSYPASYPWVVSVANADCNGNVVLSSQRNAQVDIAAPGTAVLSAVAAKSRAIRAALSLNGRSLSATALGAARPPAQSSFPGIQEQRSAAYYPEEVSAAMSKGAEAAAAGVFPEPRPLVGTLPGQKTAPLAVCAMRPLLLTLNQAQAAAPAINTATTGAGQEATAVRESRKAAGVAALKAAPGCVGVTNKMCLVELPSQVDDYTEVCLAHLACLKGNAAGILVYARNGDDPMFNLDGKEMLPRLQANCGTRCACWGVLSELLAGKTPPLAAVIGAGQGRALAAQLAEDTATAAAGMPRPRPLTATLSVFNYPYRHFDGTSMATPHVTGVAARLWATRPTCKASQVRTALQEGVFKLRVPEGEVGLGSGMVNLPLAQRRLAELNC